MFRLTIRDLLWLTVVVALGVAWWLDRGRLAKNSTGGRGLLKFSPEYGQSFDPAQ